LVLSIARESIIQKLHSLPPEPTEPPIIRIAVRIMDGTRIERKFAPTHTLEMIFDFVAGHLANKLTDQTFMSPNSPPLGGPSNVIPWKISDYSLLLNYPKRVLSYQDKDKTLEQLSIKDQSMFFINPSSK